MLRERIVTTNGVEICTESVGDASDPLVLLMMGATASLVWWPEAFCRLLAERGRYVVRYDNRDTGRSTTYPPGAPGYTLDDMAADAVAVLDAYGAARAHLVGASLGGMIAQIVALAHPERVSTLTLVMSGPVAAAGVDLPPIAQKVIDHHMGAAALDWSDPEAVLAHGVGGWRVTAGSRHPFDEELITALAREDYRRARSPQSASNHALLHGGEWCDGQLSRITAPTLVIHGTEDPVLPYPHAQFLAHTIPRARLLTLDGTGHEIHRADWPPILDAIAAHTTAR